jgi:holin-like protein
MDGLHALLTLLGFTLAGEVLAHVAGLPVPGPVLGMALLLAALVIRRGVSAELERVSALIQRHLSLLFIPAGVGLMTHAAVLRAEGGPLLLALAASTLLTLSVTAWTLAWMLRSKQR